MVYRMLPPNDYGGNLARALGQGYSQARESREGEQKDARAEQRKVKMVNNQEEQQRSRLSKALMELKTDERYTKGTPEERLQATYEKIAPIDPNVANHMATQGAAILKAQQPGKGPAPSNVPVPPETSAKIQKVMDNSKGLSASALAQKFDESGVERAFSNSYVETRRREDETKTKNDLKQENATRAEKLEFHKESAKFDEELLHKTQTAKKQLEAIKDIEKRINSGNIKPNNIANIFKGMGKIGDKISKAFITEDAAAIEASIPQLLEGWKDIFGVRLSDADLKILEDKLPSAGKSPEANKAVLGILRKYADVTLLRSKIASDIRKENGDLRPLGYANKIEERYDEAIKPIKIINPNNGKTIEIPAYQLSAALDKGAKLVNE
jgi:hypothetical protein